MTAGDEPAVLDWAELRGQALAAGVAMGEFWDLTPRETMETIVRRRERERERDVTVAWLVVALGRARRLPELTTLLRPRRRTRQLTGAERAAREQEFARLQAQMGLSDG